MDDLFPELLGNEDYESIIKKEFGEDVERRLICGREVEINPYISNDFKKLQEHYTILLNYCKDLEKKVENIKNEKELCERRIYWLNLKLNEREE